MPKSTVSDKFKNFESRSVQKLDEVRKQEKQSQGCPLPIGWSGVAIISNASAKDSKKGDLYASVEAKVVNDETYEGKTFTASFRMIKDTTNCTKEDAYGYFLDSLEDLGLERSTREDSEKGMGDYFDELLNTPHYIAVTITKDPSGYNDGKKISVCVCESPDQSGRAPFQGNEEVEGPDYSDKKICTYLAKDHYIISCDDSEEEDTYHLVSVKGGKDRPKVLESKITFK